MPEYTKVSYDVGSMRIDLVRRESDGATIPCSAENKDYQEFLQWVTDGGVLGEENVGL